MANKIMGKAGNYWNLHNIFAVLLMQYMAYVHQHYVYSTKCQKCRMDKWLGKMAFGVKVDLTPGATTRFCKVVVRVSRASETCLICRHIVEIRIRMNNSSSFIPISRKTQKALCKEYKIDWRYLVVRGIGN